MNISPVKIFNTYKNINFGLSGLDKAETKPTEDPKILKDSEYLKYTVEESIRRWNVDLPIPGNVTHGGGHSTNVMLNHNGSIVFAHVKQNNKVDRIIAISDDGNQSTTRTFVYDNKTGQLNEYKKEIN